MDKDEIKTKAEKIKGIYQEYMNKINELKVEQDKIIAEFIKDLEKAKIEEIKDSL